MLLHELDEEKNPARHYVLGNEYIGLDHNYYLTDEQGSVRYVLDAAGNVQNDYQYDAFGQRIAGHENIPNRLRYNAQIEDDLTGLYYLRARYYNTGIGRFTQEDVIYNDGLNLYAYCNSNPVMYEDPSGYASIPGDYNFVGPVSEKELKNYYKNIRAYQGKAVISKIPYEYRVAQDSVIEMDYKGRKASGTNAAGWERNSAKYFRSLNKKHPEYFSKENLNRIKKGKVPKVDKQFVEFFPQYANYEGDNLRHHHVGGGGQAYAIPSTLHPGYGGVHNYEKKAGVTGNDYLTNRAQSFENRKNKNICYKKVQRCDVKR